MRAVVLASLRAHARRYVASSIAVAASVAFVALLGVLVAGARAGFMAGAGAPYRGADVVVRAPTGGPERGPACCPDTLDVADAIDLVDRLGANAAGLGRVQLPARGAGGAPLGRGGAGGGTTVGPLAAAPELRWQTLVAGRFPVRPDEAVVHVWDARAWGVTVGDRLQLGEGAAAVRVDVVGLVTSPSTWTQASVYVPWARYVRWRDEPTFHVGSVAVRGEPGPLPEGMAAQPAGAYVAEGLAALNHGVDLLALPGLLFGGVALGVSTLVVANTFSVVFARRAREFALLRCVGATRGQVLGAVRREAAAIGGLASLVGTLAGAGLGYGLLPKLATFAPATPWTTPAPPAPWLLGAFAGGLLVTLAASWGPTRAVVRVSPLDALRSRGDGDARVAVGRTRLAFAALLLIAGSALLGLAVRGGAVALLPIGGAGAFAGVLLFGLALVPRLLRLAGAPLGPLGRWAAENAARHPRRTAASAGALLIGVTLTSAVLTGTATWRAAVDEVQRRHHPIDAALVARAGPLPAALLDRVRRTPGVEEAVAVEGVLARVGGFGAPLSVVAAPGAARVARDGGAFARARPGTIRLDLDAFVDPEVRPGDRVTVRVGARRVRLRVVALTGWGRAGVVAPDTLALLTDAPETRAVWVRASPAADPLRLVGALHRLAGAAGAQVEDRLQARAVAEREWALLTRSALGLLGACVLIALVGVTNTLGLSVLERAREHALLRALGLTRGQVRRLVATEAALLSLVTGVLGTGLGVGFAAAGYATFVKRAMPHAALQVPGPSLVGVVLVAALAGLLAGLLPARRAARVTPAAGLAGDGD